MKIVTTAAELIAAINAERELPGRAALKVALVPTMGALHKGHLSLVGKAREYADFVVTSIFVNPLQFGVGEDFDKYPRTLEADAALLESAGVNVIFTPTSEVIYPEGVDVANALVKQHPTFSSGLVGTILEGAARPGHFDGMLAVVARLFELVTPNLAVFGIKDAQQLFLIKRMAANKFPTLQIIEGSIIREVNGLAMSSRNRYLTPQELETASHLFKALNEGKVAAELLAANPSTVINTVRTSLERVPEAKLDYLTLVDPNSFENIEDSFTGQALMLIAAVVGDTRLIDNLIIDFQEPFA